MSRTARKSAARWRYSGEVAGLSEESRQLSAPGSVLSKLAALLAHNAEMAQQTANTRHSRRSAAASQQRGPLPPVRPVSLSAAPCLWHSTRSPGRTQSCQASNSSGEATASTSTSRAESLKKPVELLFKPSGKSVQALPGEYFADVSVRAADCQQCIGTVACSAAQAYVHSARTSCTYVMLFCTVCVLAPCRLRRRQA